MGAVFPAVTSGSWLDLGDNMLSLSEHLRSVSAKVCTKSTVGFEDFLTVSARGLVTNGLVVTR